MSTITLRSAVGEVTLPISPDAITIENRTTHPITAVVVGWGGPVICPTAEWSFRWSRALRHYARRPRKALRRLTAQRAMQRARKGR